MCRKFTGNLDYRAEAHIKIDQAEKALESVDAMIKEAAEKGLCGGLKIMNFKAVLVQDE
jgi:hypothetical protein